MTRLRTLAGGTWRADAYPGATGAGVRVAVIDSGADEAAMRGGPSRTGVSFDAAGARGDDAHDRHGHGSSVVATIRAAAPDVEILPVKVFDLELRATVDALVAAIDFAAGAGVHLINLSLGTTNVAHRLRLGEALVRAARAGAAVVAADVDESGTTWLPGSLPLAIGVSTDRTVPPGTAVVTASQEGAVRVLRARAAGAPAVTRLAGGEPDPGGVSFAVATVTGLLALQLSAKVPE